MQNKHIEVKGVEIKIIEKNQEDYFSLTDMVKSLIDTK